MVDSVHVSLDGAVAQVRVDRPPANHFDLPTMVGLADALHELDGDPRCRAVVLGSIGKHFCAGMDFAAIGAAPAGALTAPVDAVADPTGGDEQAAGTSSSARAFYDQAIRLFQVQTPIVAAVQGSAVGGGLGLACVADFRVADPQSRFVANFALLGLHQGFGLTVSLPRIVGTQVAAEMFLTGVRITGERAYAVGLADRLTEPGGQVAAATELAEKLAAAAPLAVRSMRQTLRGSLADEVRAALELEIAEQSALFTTVDAAEGIAASLARRPPVFIGK